MDQVKNLFESVSKSLSKLASTENIVGKPISSGNNIVIPLVEISVGFGVGGGSGEGRGKRESKKGGRGIVMTGTAGGGVSISPVGVLVVEGDSAEIKGVF